MSRAQGLGPRAQGRTDAGRSRYATAPRMHLVTLGWPLTRTVMTHPVYHQCMTPRVRSTRGVINHSLGPRTYALGPQLAAAAVNSKIFPSMNVLSRSASSIPSFLADRAPPQIASENEYSRIQIEQGWVGLFAWLAFLGWLFMRPPRPMRRCYQPS